MVQWVKNLTVEAGLGHCGDTGLILGLTQWVKGSGIAAVARIQSWPRNLCAADAAIKKKKKKM